MRPVLLVLILLGMMMSVSLAQEDATQTSKKTTASVSPTARLAAAKTIFVKNGGGSDLPFNVISGAIESWGRFIPVDAPEKADIVVEVASPNDPGIAIKAPDNKPKSERDQKMEDAGKQLEVSEIKMIVTDPRSKIVLWAGREQTGFAMKQKSKTDKIVEAAHRLFTKFHDRVEPPAPQ